jgi:hypothetical protein
VQVLQLALLLLLLQGQAAPKACQTEFAAAAGPVLLLLVVH